MDDLFDWEESRRRRDDGMARADDNADPIWKVEFESAVHTAARELPLLTTDDVIRRLAPGASTHEPRASGPIMTRCAKYGWIEKVKDANATCKRPSRHGGMVTLWKSLLFQEPVT